MPFKVIARIVRQCLLTLLRALESRLPVAINSIHRLCRGNDRDGFAGHQAFPQQTGQIQILDEIQAALLLDAMFETPIP